MNSYVFKTLEWLYNSVTHDYALAIVVLTLALKIITLPADIFQKITTRKTAALSPQIVKIQKKYKGDQALIQRKTTELYKQNKVNQLAGCLPMAFSLLLLIIFFNGLSNWANINTTKLFLEAQKGNIQYIENYKWLWVNNIWMPDSGIAPIVMKGAAFAKLPFDKMSHHFNAETISQLKAFASTITPANSSIYDNIMNPVSAQFGAVMNGWFILPLVAGVSMLLQQFLTLKFTPKNAAQPGMNKGMLYGMSVFSIIICFQYNSAFSIYWIVSNLFTICSTLVLGIALKPKKMPQEAT